MYEKVEVKVFYSEEDGGYIAICPTDDSLKCISAFGDTRAKALNELEVVLEMISMIEEAKQHKEGCPGCK